MVTEFTLRNKGEKNDSIWVNYMDINADSIYKRCCLKNVISHKKKLSIRWGEYFFYQGEKILVIRIDGVNFYSNDGYSILYSKKKGIIGTYSYYITETNLESAWNFTGSRTLLKFMETNRFYYKGYGLNFL